MCAYYQSAHSAHANIATAVPNRIAHLHNALVHARLHKTRANTLSKKKSTIKLFTFQLNARVLFVARTRLSKLCPRVYITIYIYGEKMARPIESSTTAAAQVEGYFIDQSRAQSTKP